MSSANLLYDLKWNTQSGASSSSKHRGPSQGGDSGMELHPRDTPTVLCLSWNFDGSALAVGTADGFLIYSTELLPSSSAPSSASSSMTPGSVNQLVEVCNRRVPGGVGHIALFQQSSVLLFAGFSTATRNKVTLWDDSRAEKDDLLPTGSDNDDGGVSHSPSTVAMRCTIATLTVSSPVYALRCHPQLFAIAERARVHLYTTQGGLHHVETFLTPSASDGNGVDNNSNTIAIAPFNVREMMKGMSCSVLRMVMLGDTPGSVRCIHYFFRHDVMLQQQLHQHHSNPAESTLSSARGTGGGGGPPSSRAASARRSHFSANIEYAMQNAAKPELRAWVLTPHHHGVRCIAISSDGSRAVTASHNGTVLKLLDVKNVTVLRQFNRGMQPTRIHSLAINVESTLAACLSDANTIHVFSLTDTLPHQRRGGGDAAADDDDDEDYDSVRNDSLSSGGNGSLSGAVRGIASYIANNSLLSSTATVANAAAFLQSDRAIATFSLKMSSDEHRSAMVASRTDSAAILSESEYAHLKEQRVDVSENSGFDSRFTCLQFRPSSHPSNLASPSPATATKGSSSSGAAAANHPNANNSSSSPYVRKSRSLLLVACGNILPAAVGVKSKCLQIVVDTSVLPAVMGLRATSFFPKDPL